MLLSYEGNFKACMKISLERNSLAEEKWVWGGHVTETRHSKAHNSANGAYAASSGFAVATLLSGFTSCSPLPPSAVTARAAILVSSGLALHRGPGTPGTAVLLLRTPPHARSCHPAPLLPGVGLLALIPPDREGWGQSVFHKIKKISQF